MLTFFIYLIDINFQPTNEYEEDLKPFGFLFPILVIIYCFYYLLNQKRFYVYNTYFEIKVLFKTDKYFYSEIKTHYSEEFQGKYSEWTEHYLVFNTDEKITIVTTEYDNFHEFFYEIKQRIKKNKKLNTLLKQPKSLRYAVICGIISLVLFYFSSYFYDFRPIDHKDYLYMQTVLQNDETFVRNGEGKKQIEIEVIEQKDFNFIISGNSYAAISDQYSFNETFKKGNKIAIGIKKDEFIKKISKTKKLSFLDKYFNFKLIRVHQIKDATGKSLIDLEEINRLNTESNYLSIGTLSLFGLLFLFLTFGNYKAHLKTNK
ncbi:hypothetical protein ACFSX9_04725 [Flavobacterium ardleyense]|uniref:Uncharacterized protein n=1 Tax=Flavobacterium ardleyense TaxID=2038737 RepID=A0ABW5Z5K0_9FLAO